LLSILFFSAIITVIGIERYYSRKFNSTDINVPLARLREKWGKEDRSIILYKNEIIIFYDRGLLGDSYVFKIDTNTKMVNSKFIDD